MCEHAGYVSCRGDIKNKYIFLWVSTVRLDSAPGAADRAAPGELLQMHRTPNASFVRQCDNFAVEAWPSCRRALYSDAYGFADFVTRRTAAAHHGQACALA